MSPFPGQQFQEGQAVYPDQDGQQAGVFPDGTPFTRSQNRKSRYVFVWKTWGKYIYLYIIIYVLYLFIDIYLIS